MAYPARVPPSRTISFLTLCEASDPNFYYNKNHYVQYEFSNRRLFQNPLPLYGTATATGT